MLGHGNTGWLTDLLTAWTGIRIDAKDPIEGGEEAVSFREARGRDPREKRAIFPDGPDIETIERIREHFHGRKRIGYGWGTLITDDFRGLGPDGGLDPVSIVCRVVAANGRPTVRLCDNPAKARGPEAEIARYKRVVGLGAQVRLPVVVWGRRPRRTDALPRRALCRIRGSSTRARTLEAA